VVQVKLESKIQSEIIKYLKTRKDTFTYKHDPYPTGYPDIEHIENGKVFLFEVKRTLKHEATPLQILRHKQLSKAGAIVEIVYNLKQVKQTLNKYLV
jgi:penicillin-binding protein-related factor A (putative recombinase)